MGPYRIPNVKIDSYAAYTNTVPASSYRGLGAAQVTFPGESQMDELAEKLRCDPVRFRLKNLANRGESINPVRAADRRGRAAEMCAKWPPGCKWKSRCRRGMGGRCAARRAMRARIR